MERSSDVRLGYEARADGFQPQRRSIAVSADSAELAHLNAERLRAGLCAASVAAEGARRSRARGVRGAASQPQEARTRHAPPPRQQPRRAPERRLHRLAATGPRRRGGRPEPARRNPLSRRTKVLVGVMFTVGVLLFAEAAVTVAWREPFSAIFAAQDQGELDDELSLLEAEYAEATSAEDPRRERRAERIARRQERDLERIQERIELRHAARDLSAEAEPGSPLGRLRIDAIDGSFVFVSGTGDPSLQEGPGHYDGTSLPGQRGTVGIAGHRTTYGAPFKRLDDLELGDEIEVRMPYGEFSYEVQDTRIVAPSEISVMLPLDYDRLVLTACHPLFSMEKRIVVFAELEDSVPRDQLV